MEFGASWWARRWIEALGPIGWRERLNRGRAYARGGRVVDVEIAPGVARARVHGSRRPSYRVTIALEPFDELTWARVYGVIAGRALFAAKLLAGDLPPEVVDLCESVGAPLFPRREGELRADCSCPDWVNPCKHIVALCYVLAAEFDRDPFLLFRLRGRTREELIGGLRARRGVATPEPAEPSAPEETPDPLDPDPTRFWTIGPELARLEIEIGPPEIPGAVLKRLGRPPGWGGQDELFAGLELLYRTASASVRELALGERESAVGQGHPTFGDEASLADEHAELADEGAALVVEEGGAASTAVPV